MVGLVLEKLSIILSGLLVAAGIVALVTIVIEEFFE